MTRHHPVRTAAKSAVAIGGATALGYGVWAGVTWWRYGRVAARDRASDDALLDRFMPEYEVVERHSARIAAPAAQTLAALYDLDLEQSPILRAIFNTRAFVIGDGGPRFSRSRQTVETARPRGLLAMTKSIGWGVLAEEPGREIVMGAVTQPWKPDVKFRPLPPDEFAAFREPDFVKIVWTLRADPIGRTESIARTETRVITTDQAARDKFRRYWSLVSPGVILIRRIGLRLVKKDAERRAAAALLP
jgi:hypothetical protein